nr:retrovirus-related Pol polyprotein from transposon TNT 1-94 [Tanacetum cinerariifolium]
MTPATISSGLMSNPPSSTPFVPPSRTDWDLMFQAMFDELLNPPPSVDLPASEVIAFIVEVVAPEPAASTGSPSSITVDQDAPSPTSSSSDIIPTVVHSAAPNSKHVNKWTKDHPLDNIIGELGRPLKYALESLKKYGMESSDPMDTPMVEKFKLNKYPQGKAVDPTHYRGMVGTLMYLTSSRSDLTFVVCMCSRYQEKPIEKHKAVDDALATLADRLEFGKGIIRLKTDIKPKEATFQVALDALALTSFYQTFLITAEVPAIYIEILQICPKIPSQQFEDLPLEHEILSFIRDLGHTRDIHYLTDVNMKTPKPKLESEAYKTYYAYASGEKTLKLKYVRKKSDSNTSPKKKHAQATKDVNVDSKETKSDNDGDGDDLTHPNLSNYKANDEEEEEEEKVDDEEMSSNQREQDEEDDLYRDVNINLERSDAEMTNAQSNQDMEDTHVTLTTVPPVVRNKFFYFIRLCIVDNYLASKMKEAVDVAVQLQTNKLGEEAQAKNQEFLNQIDSNMKKIIKEHVQAQVSKIMPKIEKYVTKSLGAEVLVRSTNQPQTSYVVIASLSEFEVKKILIDKIETNKSINRGAGQKVDDLKEHSHQEFNTGHDDVIPVRETLEDVSQWNPPSSPTLDCEWNKTKSVDKRPHQPWISQLAQATGTQSSFNKFLATPIDFSAFIMSLLKINNLTQEVLTDRTYDLIKGTCKSVVELEYHLKEVFKANNDY